MRSLIGMLTGAWPSRHIYVLATVQRSVALGCPSWWQRVVRLEPVRGQDNHMLSKWPLPVIFSRPEAGPDVPHASGKQNGRLDLMHTSTNHSRYELSRYHDFESFLISQCCYEYELSGTP
jgi:hypothetical protein